MDPSWYKGNHFKHWKWTGVSRPSSRQVVYMRRDECRHFIVDPLPEKQEAMIQPLESARLGSPEVIGQVRSPSHPLVSSANGVRFYR